MSSLDLSLGNLELKKAFRGLLIAQSEKTCSSEEISEYLLIWFTTLARWLTNEIPRVDHQDAAAKLEGQDFGFVDCWDILLLCLKHCTVVDKPLGWSTRQVANT